MCQTVTAILPVPHIELKIRNKLTTQLLMLSRRESGVETSINRPDLIDSISQQVSDQASERASKQANVVKNPSSAFHRLFLRSPNGKILLKRKAGSARLLPSYIEEEIVPNNAPSPTFYIHNNTMLKHISTDQI
jgi:hypothetical protein